MADMPKGGAGGLAADAAGGPGKASVGPGSGSASSASKGAGKGLDPAATGATATPSKGGDASEAPQALGAGGSSAAQTGEEKQASAGLPGGKAGAAAAAAVPAAGAVAQVMLLAAIFNWFKTLFFGAMAALANLWTAIAGVILGVVKGVAGFFLSIGAGISGALGGAVSVVAGAVTAGVSTVLVVTVAASSLVIGANAASQLAQRDGGVVEQCMDAANAKLAETGEPTDATGDTLKNAQTAFSVLSAWGMPDENIAGILGNWEKESGIDPTSVENIFSEPFHIGPEKQAAEAAGFGGFTNYLGNTMDVRGLGLGQWTNGRGQLLIDHAKATGQPWHKIETQLGFMVSNDNPGSVAIIKEMLKTSLGSPSAAALHFHHVWEVSADGAAGLAARTAAAEAWMGKFSGWSADQALADSILAQANVTLDGANADSAAQIRESCIGADGAGTTLKQGGMTLEEAQKLMDLYLAEGDSFLDGRYGQQGGPGSCGNDHVMNCVSFSTYFANKYTTFQTYPMGDGIRTAYTISEETGTPMSSNPTPYSVGSGPGSGPEGHTFVVLGVQGDQVIIGEAGYCSNRGSVRVASKSELSAFTFVPMHDMLLPPGEVKTS